MIAEGPSRAGASPVRPCAARCAAQRFCTGLDRLFLRPLFVKLWRAKERAAAERIAEGVENNHRKYREGKISVSGVLGGSLESHGGIHDKAVRYETKGKGSCASASSIAAIPCFPHLSHPSRTDGLEDFVRAKFAFWREDHFTGTRCFSSSNQFTTMLILRGTSAGDEGVPGGFIMRNRLPSGWMSQGVPEVTVVPA